MEYAAEARTRVSQGEVALSEGRLEEAEAGRFRVAGHRLPKELAEEESVDDDDSDQVRGRNDEQSTLKWEPSFRTQAHGIIIGAAQCRQSVGATRW